jgi:hypothetical protein
LAARGDPLAAVFCLMTFALAKDIAQSEVGKDGHLIDLVDRIQGAAFVFFRARQPGVAKEIRRVENVVDAQIQLNMNAAEQKFLVQLDVEPRVQKMLFLTERLYQCPFVK